MFADNFVNYKSFRNDETGKFILEILAYICYIVISTLK